MLNIQEKQSILKISSLEEVVKVSGRRSGVAIARRIPTDQGEGAGAEALEDLRVRQELKNIGP